MQSSWENQKKILAGSDKWEENSMRWLFEQIIVNRDGRRKITFLQLVQYFEIKFYDL